MVSGPPKKRPSSCFGDNGGPLYCGENKDILVGVSSTGSGIRCNGKWFVFFLISLSHCRCVCLYVDVYVCM